MSPDWKLPHAMRVDFKVFAMLADGLFVRVARKWLSHVQGVFPIGVVFEDTTEHGIPVHMSSARASDWENLRNHSPHALV